MLSQSIRYPAKTGIFQDAFLIELPMAVLESGELYLKGADGDSAILTTSAATYKIREAHTSNIVHVVPKVLSEVESDVVINTSAYFELEKIIPSLESVKAVLTKYTYPNTPEDQIPDILCEATIYTSFQASNLEIDAVLKRERAVLIDGKYRKFSADYLMRFFEILQANCILQDQVITECTSEQLAEYITEHEDEFPSDISLQILNVYCKDGKLATEEVVRLFGSEILKAKKSWSEQELLSTLNKLVGDLNSSIEMLAGLHICEESFESNQKKIVYFSQDQLSENPERRFEQLYSRRPKWSYEEIASFLTEIAPNYNGVDALIVKYCRLSTGSDGVKYVTSKLVFD